jgi:hypothetical protein
MRKELILSAAEKEQRRQIIEQNRQRRDQPVKIKSLPLVSIDIHHKRININGYKNQYTVHYYSNYILRLLCEMKEENVSFDKAKQIIDEFG